VLNFTSVLLTLPTSFSLGCKGFGRKNTLAYLSESSETNKKGFVAVRADSMKTLGLRVTEEAFTENKKIYTKTFIPASYTLKLFDCVVQ
jgi:hypothetical protein